MGVQVSGPSRKLNRDWTFATKWSQTGETHIISIQFAISSIVTRVQVSGPSKLNLAWTTDAASRCQTWHSTMLGNVWGRWGDGAGPGDPRTWGQDDQKLNSDRLGIVYCCEMLDNWIANLNCYRLGGWIFLWTVMVIACCICLWTVSLWIVSVTPSPLINP